MSLKYTSFLQDEDYDELEDIDWLSNCGSGLIFPGFNIVGSYEEAKSMIESIEYENFQLDRQADLSVYLDSKHKPAYQEWNEHIYRTKEKMAGVFERISKICSERNFTPVVVDSIKWDIVSYFQEKVFMNFKKPGFYHGMIYIYRAGRLPCGYIGTYPKGKVCIY